VREGLSLLGDLLEVLVDPVLDPLLVEGVVRLSLGAEAISSRGGGGGGSGRGGEGEQEEQEQEEQEQEQEQEEEERERGGGRYEHEGAKLSKLVNELVEVTNIVGDVLHSRVQLLQAHLVHLDDRYCSRIFQF